MRRVLLLLLLALLVSVAPAQAHVGSPNVFYDGDAGPYPVRVIVRPPVVIPGLAEITVRLRDGRKVDGVTLQPMQWKAGLKGAPPPDAAVPVPGAPGSWSAQLWLMTPSSSSVRVRVRARARAVTALTAVLLALPSGVERVGGTAWTAGRRGRSPSRSTSAPRPASKKAGPCWRWRSTTPGRRTGRR